MATDILNTDSFGAKMYIQNSVCETFFKFCNGVLAPSCGRTSEH